MAEYIKLAMTAANALASWEGLKGMTRRVMQPQPPRRWPPTLALRTDCMRPDRLWDDRISWIDVDAQGNETKYEWKPRYAPGQKVYIGEPLSPQGKSLRHAVYTADRTPVLLADGEEVRWTWRVNGLAGRYMRRNCARMVGVIGDGVRAERVRDITHNDRVAEGCPPDIATSAPASEQWFTDIWDSIHGKGAWARNDYVWVYPYTITARGAEAQELLR